jgi:hypothetical protein
MTQHTVQLTAARSPIAAARRPVPAERHRIRLAPNQNPTNPTDLTSRLGSGLSAPDRCPARRGTGHVTQRVASRASPNRRGRVRW